MHNTIAPQKYCLILNYAYMQVSALILIHFYQPNMQNILCRTE